MGLNDLRRLVIQKPEQCDKCEGSMEYLGIGRYRCINCGNEMLDEYGTVREYCDKHRVATIWQVARDTGISREKIKILLEKEPSSFSASVGNAPKGNNRFSNKVYNFGNYSKNR